MNFLAKLAHARSEERARRAEQQELAQQEREQAIKAAQLKEQEEKPAFAVGKTQDGRITLSIGGYHNIWINMTNEGVDQLVAMLLAAKNTEEEE